MHIYKKDITLDKTRLANTSILEHNRGMPSKMVGSVNVAALISLLLAAHGTCFSGLFLLAVSSLFLGFIVTE